MFTYNSADEVVHAAFCIMEAKMADAENFTSPEIASNYLRLRLGQSEREIFCVLFLNSNHQLISAEDLFLGTIDQASVYPREVVKRALQLNASSCILSHNHPSGNTTPSDADRNITRRLQEALQLVAVSVIDHIIVGPGGSTSFAEKGLI